MVAIRLLPFATAVFLSVLHTELVTARPLHREGLSLRSLGSEAYDDGAIALRELFDEDSLEEYFSREPTTPAPDATRGRGRADTREPSPDPARSRSPSPQPQPPPPPPPQPVNSSSGNTAKSKGRRSFDEDDTQDLVRRIEAEIFPPPPHHHPGNRETNKPLRPRPVTPPPPVPEEPAKNKPLPAIPKGKRSFDEDEFERRAILDEIVEELLRRDYFDDMDLD
ncbi:hypothetical protein H1R20_g763, partial [Candolleomyces eurysporus]